jgi:hypothetical protein
MVSLGRLIARLRTAGGTLLSLLLIATPISAQDLDPRAYANVPVDATLFISGFSVSHGGVLTDPTLPLTDVNATIEAPSVGVARTFSLFGRTAQAFGVVPYAWAQVSANVLEDSASVTRAGLSDMRLRFSVLVRGAPAASVREIAKASRRTILGTSLTVVAPTGQFFSDKLINLGTNRWSLKPEFAVSQPLGERWLFDAYAGLWMFTDNPSFYPGDSSRSQAPIGAFQSHLSYNFQSQSWAAFDMTYYAGGRTTVDGAFHDDRQSNLRIGATLAVPVGRRHSVRLAVSRGAIVRFGANFSTISIGWQTAWLPSLKKS